MTRKTVTAKKKKHLKALIRKAIKKDGYFCDLNFIDISQITDLQSVFFSNPISTETYQNGMSQTQETWKICSCVPNSTGIFQNVTFTESTSRI